MEEKKEFKKGDRVDTVNGPVKSGTVTDPGMGKPRRVEVLWDSGTRDWAWDHDLVPCPVVAPKEAGTQLVYGDIVTANNGRGLRITKGMVTDSFWHTSTQLRYTVTSTDENMDVAHFNAEDVKPYRRFLERKRGIGTYKPVIFEEPYTEIVDKDAGKVVAYIVDEVLDDLLKGLT